MMNKDIAIVGVSFSIAGIQNLQEYYEAITAETPKIKGIPEIRKEDVEARFGPQTIGNAGYLDRIDVFDERYFGITKGEAMRMDPEQRLMLEHSVKALYNAGYTRKEVANNRTGFFHTYYYSSYRYFFDDFSNVSLTSHMSGMIGTKVANHLGLKGPVVGYDTTCSSSLVALYYACQSLHIEDCEYAFVGGVNLGVAHAQKVAAAIYSNSEKCLPFDEKADGTVPGEGVICLLLKTLDKAKKDNDTIYGVIKGGAINHGGERIQNITAPSPLAQKEVLLRAWEKSNISVEDIGFIEAHGTGTELGDPIEFEGIQLAFKEKNKKTTCGISSAKGQVGHLDAMSGLAGIVRSLVSLNYQIKPKQQGFQKLNPHIRTELPNVYVQDNTEAWETDKKRMLGVSSFGLTGTNVHMILQEYTTAQQHENSNDKSIHFARLSAKSEALIQATKKHLITYIENNQAVNLHDFSYSLNKLYDAEDAVTASLIFRNNEALLEALKQQTVHIRKDKTLKSVIVLVPGIYDWNAHERTRLLQEYPEIWAEIEKTIPVETFAAKEDFIKNVLIQYGILKSFMQQKDFAAQVLFGGQGKILQQLLSYTSQTEKENYLKTITANSSKDFKATSFINYLNNLQQLSETIFYVVGDQGEMLQAFQSKSKEQHFHKFYMGKNVSGYIEMQQHLFNHGFAVKIPVTKQQFLQNLGLPVFLSKRHWVENVTLDVPDYKTPTNPISSEKNTREFTETEIIQHIKTIWQHTLRIENIGEEDSFFDIGGSSLLGLDVMMDIENVFGIRMEYQDIFQQDTIQKLAEFIAQKLHSEASVVTTTEVAQQQPAIDKEEKYKAAIQEVETLTLATKTFQTIFLTGATGFLGVYLLKELLENTTASIICLVRTSEEMTATERCFKGYESYFGKNALSEAHKNRIEVVAGDVTIAGLGIEPANNALFQSIDIVYHTAAAVNHYGKKERSDLINFHGTKHVFEWAKAHHIPNFNHISSVAVSGSYIENVAEINYNETDLDLGQQFGSYIYSSSKFKAEKYLHEQQNDAMTINVLRLGNLGGDSVRGNFQRNIENNIVYLLFKSLYNSGIYPENYERNIEISPVDQIAKAIYVISTHANNALQTFHLYKFENLTLQNITAAFQHHNITVHPVAQAIFEERIATVISETDANKIPFFGIAQQREQNMDAYTHYHIQTQKTAAFLARIGFSFEPDAMYYSKIIAHCIRMNFFKPEEQLHLNTVSST
ncbi:polyketide synthase PksN [Kordia sp. SMS9]|uniref:beta-ketoacyl synthase N-terminal-like domain-containing protein n=1 Tax=Kordia sp. SMS9 TaxID=2282170 RepID=UPI000E0DE1F7|nr:beta-ketoacyl synthase N-terminal-like domain-containing protein [Kordia sp. SMS9]AXG70730.1 polyketide synthase PksN [Kordia sp. SMS9]